MDANVESVKQERRAIRLAVLITGLTIGNMLLVFGMRNSPINPSNNVLAFLTSFLIQSIISGLLSVAMICLTINAFRRQFAILGRMVLLLMSVLVVLLPVVGWTVSYGAKRDAFEAVWITLTEGGKAEETVAWARQILANSEGQDVQEDVAVTQHNSINRLEVSVGGQVLYPSVQVSRELGDENVFVAINYYGGRSVRFGFFIGSTDFVVPPGVVKQARKWRDGVYVFLDEKR